MNRFWRDISPRFSFFLLAFFTCLAVGRVAIAAQLTLSWADASSNEDGFKLERKTGTAGTYAQIATAAVNTTMYADSTLSNSTTYCYRVRAYNTAGDSTYSNEACGTTAAPDTQFPTASLTAPANGATVSGTAVTVSATASDNVGVVGMQFLLDGANLGGEDTTSPYSIAWNTTTAANGSHALTAIARDAAGNATTSATVTVTVSNAASDTQFPTASLSAPASGATVSGAAVVVSATASDNVGVVGVQFRLNGSNLGSEDTTAPYSISWNTTTVANGSHSLTAIARDAAGNATTSATVTVTVSNTAPPPNPAGLVAAYGFNENSGTSTSDASGQGNTGTVSGPTWTATGRYGAGLAFDGVNDIVIVDDAATLDLTTNMTLEAWVSPASVSGWRSVIMKEQPSQLTYALYAVTGSSTNFPAGEVRSGAVVYDAEAPTALAVNTWSHLATTYDGATLRLYVNGVQVASRAQAGTIETSTGALRIGGNSVWGEYFQGQIDEVRLYNRVLTASEIQTDMNTAIGSIPPPTVTYALTVTKTGTGAGAVSSTPAGITCGADCTEAYGANTAVTLTATPNAGSTFTGWSGGCTGTGSCSVTMSAAQSVTATFAIQTYALTVAKAGAGTGTVSSNPVGVNCGSDCTEAYAANTAVTLAATPAAGSTFTGWSGSCTGTGPCSVTMSTAQSVTATFALVPPTTYPLTVLKVGAGSGTVTSSSAGINCGTDCTETYTANTQVTLTAAAAIGSTFGGWSGSCTGTGTCSVTMSVARSVTATFTRPLQVQIGLFRSSTATWHLDLNSNGVFDGCTIDACLATFGISTDRPVVGDWTGIGTSQIGTFDPTTKMWELDRNGNDRWEDCTIDLCRGPFGQSSDLPVAGLWKAGMTAAGIGTFRPSTGRWYLDLNGNGKLDKGTTDARLGPFGTATDKPVVGNWAGTGVTRIGVFTPSTGNWQLDINGEGTFDGCTTDSCRGPFGTTGDLPIAGDWTGTGRTQIGVFTPATGQWKLDVSGNGMFDGCTVDACLGPFGQQGDLPVVGKW